MPSHSLTPQMPKTEHKPRQLELLAPARDCGIARLAILHGADAVYIGADDFGARSAATNSTDDIRELTAFAHQYNAKVYVTLNTIIFDNEISRVRDLVERIYLAGVDALIVQDMALLRMDIPPIALHASTQCDTRDAAKAAFLAECGFSQIVLARELSLDEIRHIHDSVDVPLEVFVHGALCVSYSGDCQASYITTGRSANRGQCAQMCRLRYSLTDSDGRRLRPDAHYLSLRDLNRIDRLADLADAGVSSFKIEGRLKDSDYVRTVVGAYSRELDRIVASSGGRYIRSSSGRAEIGFEPDVMRAFNRGFTPYFLDGRPTASTTMASLGSPKWIGPQVAKVLSANGRSIKVDSSVRLANGDGLGYFDPSGNFVGFRLNRVEGNILWPASEVRPEAGSPLYRNRDKRYDDQLGQAGVRRSIPLVMQLRLVGNDRIALHVTDDRGVYAEATAEVSFDLAKTPQRQHRLQTMSRLGDTIYSLLSLDDTLGDDRFVRASVLTSLRRSALDALDATRKSTYHFDYRRPENRDAAPFTSIPLDRHANVANGLARNFYLSHGFTIAEQATETIPIRSMADRRVMTTRYCLRRELGACLRTAGASALPSPLFLRAPGVNYRLDFDCSRCNMTVSVCD